MDKATVTLMMIIYADLRAEALARIAVLEKERDGLRDELARATVYMDTLIDRDRQRGVADAQALIDEAQE